jgi:hypothetical protein
MFTLFMLVIYFVYRQFKNIDLKEKLDKQRNEEERLELARQLNPDKFKQQRTEVNSTKRRMDGR